MKRMIKVTLILIVVFLLVWGISLIRCEILTKIHGKEFETLCNGNTMIGTIEYIKVLEYTDKRARIYCVSAGYSMGNILIFLKDGDKWKYDKWERCVWSISGTADDTVWPYWWHFFYQFHY